MLRSIALVTMAAVVLVAAGCSGDDEQKPNGPLPDAAGLLSDASESAAKITSTHFVVTTTGTVPGLAVKSIDGDLTAEGEKVAAKGTAKLELMGSIAEGKFVLVDGTLYLDPGSGSYQE
ncbi:MAG: LppX_LprAFG lipoprotein, partial [Thermocrispum sp.]